MDMTIPVVGHAPKFRLASVARVCYKFILSLFVNHWERRAKDLVRAYDVQAQPSLAEVVEEDRVEAAGGAGRVLVRRDRYRPRNAHRMAFALADEAYFKFGFRERSDANLLITRKFMHDQLREMQDLRAKDAATIVDLALYVSFLPSRAMQDMNAVDSTRAFGRRKKASSRASWGWWPFGAPNPS